MTPLLAGCVSVSGEPTAAVSRGTEPAAATSGPGHAGARAPRPAAPPEPLVTADPAGTPPRGPRGTGAPPRARPRPGPPLPEALRPEAPRPDARPSSTGPLRPGTPRPAERPAPQRSAARKPPPSRPGAGVCELGEHYGRWEPGSRQARICRHFYGD